MRGHVFTPLKPTELVSEDRSMSRHLTNSHNTRTRVPVPLRSAGNHDLQRESGARPGVVGIEALEIGKADSCDEWN